MCYEIISEAVCKECPVEGACGIDLFLHVELIYFSL